MEIKITQTSGNKSSGLNNNNQINPSFEILGRFKPQIRKIK